MINEVRLGAMYQKIKRYSADPDSIQRSKDYLFFFQDATNDSKRGVQAVASGLTVGDASIFEYILLIVAMLLMEPGTHRAIDQGYDFIPN